MVLTKPVFATAAVVFDTTVADFVYALVERLNVFLHGPHPLCIPPAPACCWLLLFVGLQGDAVRNLTWPAWEVSKKALVFPTAPGKPLPFQDEEFFKRMQDFLNTRQVRVPFGVCCV